MDNAKVIAEVAQRLGNIGLRRSPKRFERWLPLGIDDTYTKAGFYVEVGSSRGEVRLRAYSGNKIIGRFDIHHDDPHEIGAAIQAVNLLWLDQDEDAA